jgi:hypothetical protein
MLFTCYRTSRTQCSPCPILVKSTEGSSDCHPSRAAAPRRIILAILPARLDPLVSKACQVRTLLWGRNRLEHRRPFRVITARCLKLTDTLNLPRLHSTRLSDCDEPDFGYMSVLESGAYRNMRVSAGLAEQDQGGT